MRYAKALVFVALLTALPSTAAETTVGAHITVDRVFTLSASPVGAELFVQVFVSPSLALEAAVGYRRNVTNGFGGSYTYSTATDQVPVSLGAVYAFSRASSLRPWLCAGLILAPEFSSTTYSPGGSTNSSSAVDIGFQVGAGVQAAIGNHWILDGGVRYTPPMASTDSARSQLAYSFIRFQASRPAFETRKAHRFTAQARA
jgi:outer membrane protein W